MRWVCGIDLSLTSTGVGIIVRHADGDCHAAAETVTSKGKRAASLRDRDDRIVTLIKDVVHHASVAELVVIEGLFGGHAAGSMLDRSGAWWFVVNALHRRNIPVAVIAASSAKLAIGGHGRADKAVMGASLTRLWPDVLVKNEDESDALAFAHLGAVALGWDVVTLERHKSVKWQDWPTNVEEVA